MAKSSWKTSFTIEWDPLYKFTLINITLNNLYNHCFKLRAIFENFKYSSIYCDIFLKSSIDCECQLTSTSLDY